MSSCKCGPDCKCTDGDCGCNMGKCGCDPTECPKGETTVALKVEGMTCGGCVGGVKRALEAVEGVSSATVDLASKLATIKGTAKAPALIAAIEATGKKATGKSRIRASPHKHTHTPAAPTLTWARAYCRRRQVARALAVRAVRVSPASAAAPSAPARATRPCVPRPPWAPLLTSPSS